MLLNEVPLSMPMDSKVLTFAYLNLEIVPISTDTGGGPRQSRKARGADAVMVQRMRNISKTELSPEDFKSGNESSCSRHGDRTSVQPMRLKRLSWRLRMGTNLGPSWIYSKGKTQASRNAATGSKTYAPTNARFEQQLAGHVD